MFAFLAGHRADVFPDAGYADLLAPPGFGRPSVPATQMAAVMKRLRTVAKPQSSSWQPEIAGRARNL